MSPVEMRRRRGFTLIEVMTSALVLGVGVMAAVKVYSAGTKGRARVAQRTMAERAVERRLDSLEAKGAQRLPVCTGDKSCVDTAGELTPMKSSAGAYPCTQLMDRSSLKNREASTADGKMRMDTRTWAHTDSEQDTTSQMVKVSVCWRDTEGRVHEVHGTRLVMPRRGR
ncbi:MAG: type II secretion system protein [Myxococcota bacterium]